ncbi:MAG: flagellar basal body-associated protein FliL [Roseinatronobacter sp.]
MAKLLPILLMVLGLAGGTGAGWFLRPPPPEPDPEAAAAAPVPNVPMALHEIKNQFMVPLVEGNRIASIVLISLALDVPESAKAQVAQAEPRLRDRMLQVMFDHANLGLFEGVFTSNNNMGLLRRSLLEAAQATVGRDAVRGVLITEILRSAM